MRRTTAPTELLLLLAEEASTKKVVYKFDLDCKKVLDFYDKAVSKQKFSSKTDSVETAFGRMKLSDEKIESVKYWRLIDGIKAGMSV